MIQDGSHIACKRCQWTPGSLTGVRIWTVGKILTINGTFYY